MGFTVRWFSGHFVDAAVLNKCFAYVLGVLDSGRNLHISSHSRSFYQFHDFLPLFKILLSLSTFALKFSIEFLCFNHFSFSSISLHSLIDYFILYFLFIISSQEKFLIFLLFFIFFTSVFFIVYVLRHKALYGYYSI